MQLTTVFTLLTAAASVASAWEFTGYRDRNYGGGVIIYRSGNGMTNNLCADIANNVDNKMSSFKWYRATHATCSFKLYDGNGCSGTKLASSGGTWNVAALSTANDNKASSLWVDCV